MTRADDIVPILDLGRFHGPPDQKYALAQEVDRTCSEIGFLILVGHGIPDAVVDGVWEITEKYFDLPLAEKRAILLTPSYPYGYSEFAEETLSKSRDEDAAPDLKESFSIGPYDPPATLPATIWPPRPTGFREASLAYYIAMEELATTLLRLFALALGLDENWFDDKIDRHASAMRALNYPELTQAPKKRQLRASAHTDYGSLTILKPGGPGLQVQTRDGGWVDVPHVKNSFVVNLGDLMAYWTNDRWISTMHRVVAPPLEAQEARRSIAFFHNVNEDAVIECIDTCVSEGNPAKYPPITAGKHRSMKHAAATAIRRAPASRRL